MLFFLKKKKKKKKKKIDALVGVKEMKELDDDVFSLHELHRSRTKKRGDVNTSARRQSRKKVTKLRRAL